MKLVEIYKLVPILGIYDNLKKTRFLWSIHPAVKPGVECLGDHHIPV